MKPPFRRRQEDDDDRGAQQRTRTLADVLTLDRALLILIFGAGAWYASTDLRAGNVSERVRAVELRQEKFGEQRGTDAIMHAAEIATIQQQLRDIDRRTESIETGLGHLAESTAKLANAVRER